MNKNATDAPAHCAWMIRRDGKAVPCLWHIYGSAEDEEETLYAAEWLYKNTAREDTKRLVLRLAAAYGAACDADALPSEALLAAIKRKPYVFLTARFVREIAEKLPEADPAELPDLNKAVNAALNGEFLRARLGGMYNTTVGCRDLYFRVSSADFDWTGVMRGFVRANRGRTGSVTVVSDEESTGRCCLYKAADGTLLDKLPAAGFLRLSALGAVGESAQVFKS